LERLVARRPLAPPPEGPALEGATAFELSLLGLCWQREASRTPVSQRAPLYRAALQYFTEAILRASVARPLYYEQRALAAQLAGDAHSARSVASALVALWPDSPRGLYAAGRALHSFDPPAARSLLERAIALDAGNADAYVVLAITCCQLGEFEDAERWCWSGLTRAPRNANLHFWVGQSLMFRECQDEAREAFERAARLDPAHSALWAQAGLYALLAGEPALAVERYGHALALDQQDHRARVFLAAARELSGDAEGARREIDAAVAGLWPGETGYWPAAAEMLEQIGAPATARVLADAGR
jgi:tetratricopeptide (TPR) repeat protein